MSDAIITVENLGKCYRLQHQQERERYVSLRDVITSKVKGLFSKRQAPSAKGQAEEDFWALKDVSFEIKQGEVVGIIGRNGAGKSTLLKILSRITEPTKGRITLRGRVASLLEVGTGFHPELTGRENIFLNGAILGMTRAEVRSKFDEIVAFAEVEKFLDTPVKRYSSGMYVRLAFAVAAHLEPEILVVDEVLAVGDATFQKKCLGKMQDVSRGGRTVIFVSHNMAAAQTLCQRAIHLREGRLIDDGQAESVVHSYLDSGGHVTTVQTWQVKEEAPGTHLVRLRHAEVRATNGMAGQNLNITEPIDLVFEIWSLQESANLNLSVVLWTSARECAFNAISEITLVKKGLCRGICHIPGRLLNAETYMVDLYIVQDTTKIIHVQKDVLAFEVVEGARSTNWYGKWVGAVRPQLHFPLSSHFRE